MLTSEMLLYSLAFPAMPTAREDSGGLLSLHCERNRLTEGTLQSAPAELRKGGEMRLGGSSRVYVLQFDSPAASGQQ